jgi:hypothetical protein
MVRELVTGVAVTAALAIAPVASADSSDEQDVPIMHYDGVYGGRCYNVDRFIFGRAPNGQALACVAFDDVGTWVLSSPLHGVQLIGLPCSGDGAAQTPDGLPLICVLNQGWQPGTA